MAQEQPNRAGPFPREEIPPEILEWARQTIDENDYVAQIREVEQSGGLKLADFIEEIKARARGK
jgi:hypothetical protein